MLGGPLPRLINGLLYIICIEQIGERERERDGLLFKNMRDIKDILMIKI